MRWKRIFRVKWGFCVCGHCGDGGENGESRCASKLIRPSRRTEDEGGWNKAIYHTLGPGGEKARREREREREDGTKKLGEAI